MAAMAVGAETMAEMKAVAAATAGCIIKLYWGRPFPAMAWAS